MNAHKRRKVVLEAKTGSISQGVWIKNTNGSLTLVGFKFGMHTQTHTHTECTNAWAMLSKNFEGGGLYRCVCAGQSWTLFRNKPLAKGNFLFAYDLTQDTYITLLLKIHCQKPPNMLNRGHRIQFGSRGLYCVAGAKTEVLWHLVFVLVRSHIANWWNQRLADNTTGFLVPFLRWKRCELGVAPYLSCSFFVCLFFSSSSLTLSPFLFSTVSQTPF